ncbi:Citrate transporter [Botrimarina mediterranea]|uniref:Citrate transporter n=2 Tax=Botrimarina mediterranea TaxID=2528022 RepID=A0A518K566_9BACT|nr:Citrate transporter [Botrimarina mediterranea]
MLADRPEKGAMSSHSHAPPSSRPVIGAILAIALAYAGALVLGLPQRGTELVTASLAAHHADGHADSHGAGHDAGHAGDAPPATPLVTTPTTPPVWTVTPFVLLLLGIAVFPLIPATAHWWESNLSRFQVAAGLGLLTLLYYGLLHNAPLESHWPAHSVVMPSESGFDAGFVRTVMQNAILGEFVPFIILLFSLYTISGGIRITGDLQANPLTNGGFMLVGGLMASFIGTTGAAMVLIRPLLETNQERKNVVHTVVFFIFIVCNCGGCLLPIGDPPLFLGYLRGVDFFWTLNLWQPWVLTNFLLILAYLLLDEFYFYPRETEADISRDLRNIRSLRFQGVSLNGPLLLGVVAAVALLDPTKTIPGTDWHPWIYLREVILLGLVGLSVALGSATVREKNRFNYHAILEVAALFSGIFLCMQPALQILSEQGPSLGITSPMAFFWVTGGLSSVLDNAPTYVVFFETAKTLPADGANVIAGIAEPRLVAISLGAVFMGALTYIGNGPNFMVRAIAESAGVRMPSFFGYMLYSCTLLLPILAFTAWCTF